MAAQHLKWVVTTVCRVVVDGDASYPRDSRAGMTERFFCPVCGVQRVGRLCSGCGYDFIEGAKTPAVTLSRGINWVSLAIGIITLAFFGGLIYLFVLPFV